MRPCLLVPCLTLGLVVAACTTPAGVRSESETRSALNTDGNASIPFANLHGIYDWSPDGTQGVYIQSIDRQWYHAQLFAPCLDLPFAQRIGFVTEPGSGAFDRFSSILVHGMECPVKSLTRSAPPPANARHWRGSPASAAGTQSPDSAVSSGTAPR